MARFVRIGRNLVNVDLIESINTEINGRTYTIKAQIGGNIYREESYSSSEIDAKLNELMPDESFSITGQTVDELLKDLKSLKADYLLDDIDDDNYTVPIVQQIRSRLDILQEYESKHTQNIS